MSLTHNQVFVLCFSLGDRRTLRALTSTLAQSLIDTVGPRPWLVVGLWSFEFCKHGGNEASDISPEQLDRSLKLLKRMNKADVEYVPFDPLRDEVMDTVIDKVCQSIAHFAGH